MTTTDDANYNQDHFYCRNPLTHGNEHFSFIRTLNINISKKKMPKSVFTLTVLASTTRNCLWQFVPYLVAAIFVSSFPIAAIKKPQKEPQALDSFFYRGPFSKKYTVLDTCVSLVLERRFILVSFTRQKGKCIHFDNLLQKTMM